MSTLVASLAWHKYEATIRAYKVLGSDNIGVAQFADLELAEVAMKVVVAWSV